jgi:DNA-binding transcriptional LysR family regulator
MRNIELGALQIFKAVVDEGGVAKAATRLHRVPSNVTTRVKQLEARLGRALFRRQGRRLALTPDGEVLLGYADRLLRLSSEAETAMNGGAPRGPLRLGTLESVAAARLSPLLARYHLAYPDVRLDLVTGTSGALIAKVLRDELDAAFVAEPFATEGLELQPAFRERLVLITPKSVRTVRRARDIGQHTVIAFGAGCSYRRCLEEWLAQSKVVPLRVLEFTSYHAITACVAAGSGVALVPESVLSTLPSGKHVRAHTISGALSHPRTSLVWRSAHSSSALSALRSELSRTPRGKGSGARNGGGGEGGSVRTQARPKRLMK